jgi:hypothetical protein
MRLCRMLAVLAALPLALGGCGDSSTPDTSASSAAAAAGGPWLVVNTGSATPSVKPSVSGSLRPALPPVSFMPTTGAGCAISWPDTIGQVLIPMVVTPGAGSFKVTWPNRFGNVYRLTAVPQALVSGAQPEPTWQTVNTGAECEASATISGLTSGKAYIVWLDAPNTPRGLDGSRSLYSGKSGVLKPN